MYGSGRVGASWGRSARLGAIPRARPPATASKQPTGIEADKLRKLYDQASAVGTPDALRATSGFWATCANRQRCPNPMWYTTLPSTSGVPPCWLGKGGGHPAGSWSSLIAGSGARDTLGFRAVDSQIRGEGLVLCKAGVEQGGAAVWVPLAK